MINALFRILLTFNATCLLVVIFAVKSSYANKYFFQISNFVFYIPNFVLYFLYILIPIFLTGFSIVLSSSLGIDSFKKGDVESIEHANNIFLPSYLGYFFVALSVDNWETLFFVYSILFVFTFFSQALYFNPLFLIFGYEFYNIKTMNGTSIFLISRYRYKNPRDIEVLKAYRVNNYTFIERE